MKASIYFDPRKTIQSGENKDRSHIKILVEFDIGKRTRRYYQTGVYATREEFDKIIKGKYGKVSGAEADELEDKRKKLLALEKKAKDELSPGIHPDDFEPRFKSQGNQENPLDMLLAYSEELKRDGQIGTSTVYRSAYSSFKKFVDDKYNGRVSFVQVTPRWLMQYEKWLLDQERSVSTVGTHVRPMRTIFRKAIDAEIIGQRLYPFGRNKYKCPTSKGRKLALTEQQKDTVLEYSGEYQLWVDLWKFSYYCQGMNFNDIARIRRRNIANGVLTYDRTKTKLTERNKVLMEIALHPEANRLINKWGSKDISPDAYVFPVLRQGLTPLQEKHIIADWIKDVNANLELACAEINAKLEQDKVELRVPKITTYWARHTYATVLKRKGVPLEYIQESLGHADLRTTKLYLDSFDLETKTKYSNLL